MTMKLIVNNTKLKLNEQNLFLEADANQNT